MKKELIVFGDSWPYGWELKENEKPYGQLIAEKLGYKYSRYAIPSTSIDHMILQFNQFLKFRSDGVEYTALFSLTDPSRSIYFSNGPQELNTYWDGPLKGDVVANAYYKYIHSEQLEYFRLTQNLITLQSLCKQYKITDYYVNTFGRITWDLLDLQGIDFTRIYEKGKINFLDFFGCKFINSENQYFLGNTQGHPNQSGHILIAEKLSQWIN